MLYKFEFDFFPETDNNVDIFRHFKLLFGLIGDFFDSVFEIEQF